MPQEETLRDCFSRAKWVWLDLDDTLIDFKANSAEALRLTYSHFGLQRYFPSLEEWTQSYMKHNHALWDRYNRAEITQKYLRVHRFLDPISEHVAMTEEEFAGMASEMDRKYLDYLAEQKNLVDGAMELVDTLRAYNYKIGVLSNGFSDVQHRKIRTAGLEGKIDLTVLSDDIGVNKPDTRLYRHAMELAGDTDPAHHLMIGDNPAIDIAGAIAAGWDAILLAPAGNGEDKSAGCLVAHSLRPLTIAAIAARKA